MKTKPLYDSGRLEDGTHGNLSAFLAEALENGELQQVLPSGWFIGVGGVYAPIAPGEAWIIWPHLFTNEEVENYTAA